MSAYRIRKENAARKQSADETDLNAFLANILITGLAFALQDSKQTNQPRFTYRQHGLREIQNKYGLSAMRLFSILFERRQKGGINKNGESFKTLWRFNNEMIDDVAELLELRQEGKATTASKWVKHLKGKGYEPKVYAAEKDVNGKRLPKRTMTHTEYTKINQVQKSLKREKARKQREQILASPEDYITITSIY